MAYSISGDGIDLEIWLRKFECFPYLAGNGAVMGEIIRLELLTQKLYSYGCNVYHWIF